MLLLAIDGVLRYNCQWGDKCNYEEDCRHCIWFDPIGEFDPVKGTGEVSDALAKNMVIY